MCLFKTNTTLIGNCTIINKVLVPISWKSLQINFQVITLMYYQSYKQIKHNTLTST